MHNLSFLDAITCILCNRLHSLYNLTALHDDCYIGSIFDGNNATGLHFSIECYLIGE